MTKQTTLLFQQSTPEGLIEVHNKKQLRWLSLDSIKQTLINIEQPEKLASRVHQYFLACLLFIETPEKVLLGGLGGGALARYLHNRKPEISGDAVEINPAMAQLAKNYFYFPDEQWNIIIDDLRQWNNGCYDLIIIDIAEGNLTPAWLSSEKMLLQLKHQLSQQGVLVINLLVDDAQTFTQTLSNIRKVFKCQTLCLSVPDHRNIIIFAFNQPPKNYLMQTPTARAAQLTALWGLEFSTFIEQLKKDNPVGNDFF